MHDHPLGGWQSRAARAMIADGLSVHRESSMLDQIIGLILAILALVYLAYAMLRPERF